MFYSVMFYKRKAKCPSLKNKLHPYQNCTNQSDQSHEILSIGNGIIYVTLFVLPKKKKNSPLFLTILFLASQYLKHVCFTKQNLTALFVVVFHWMVRLAPLSVSLPQQAGVTRASLATFNL